MIRLVQPRASRYPITSPILFRRAGEMGWRSGQTVNVSPTGVLFTAPSPLPAADDAIEMVLTLFPPDGAAAKVKGSGRIVRVAEDAGGGAGAVAATIEAYGFLPLLGPAGAGSPTVE
jgi:hypothetical protein